MPGARPVHSSSGMNVLLPLLLILATSTASAQLACQSVFAERGTVDWLRTMNRATNEALARSPNKAALEKMVRTAFDVPKTTKTLNLGPDFNVQLIDRGLGKPEDVVVNEKGRTRLLFSNARLRRNNLHHIVGLSVSPGRANAVIITEARGSTDAYALHVVDFATGRDLVPPREVGSSTVLWSGDHEILYTVDGPAKLFDRVRALDLRAPEAVRGDFPGLLLAAREGWGVIYDAAAKEMTALHASGRRHPIGKTGNAPNIREVLGVRGNDLILRAVGPRSQTQILRLPLDGSGDFKFALLSDQGSLNGASLKDGYLFAEFQWGAKRQIRILDSADNEIGGLVVPNCCSVASSQWLVPGEKLQVTLNSEIRRGGVYVYDLKQGRWESPRLEAEMMSDGGVDYVTEIAEVTSADGRKLPMRFTRRQDAAADGRRPVYIESYGGFENEGYINPSHNPLIADFLRRGGIHAAPALRGGNEFGHQWWLDGKGENKIKTVEDLVASADWLVAKKWTSPERIVSAGASNGGLVVAAAALKSPKSFGLAIPLAGVHDLPARDALDPRFGWNSEYGDPAKEADLAWMRRFSPVDLARQAGRLPAFLVIAGRNDSRVNPDHSYRFVETLLAAGTPVERVRLVDLKNAGHWLNSTGYQDLIAWRAEVVRWTMIYDHLGMRITP